MEKLRESAEQQGKEYAVEIEKRNNKEREMKETMEQLAKNTEDYKEQLVEGAANFVVEMNNAYKGIIQDQEAKNKELLVKMQEVRIQGPPPPYYEPPSQQAMPVYQPQPQFVYQQPQQAEATMAGAMGGAMGGSLLALAATGAVGCTIM
jgi:predicted RND superfamily exporter protein